MFADLLCEEAEVALKMLGLAGEAAAKLLLLRRYADGTAVQVAVAALDASERDEHRRAED